MKVHLSRPDITEAEIQAVTDVLRSPNLSLGPKLPEFENAFADYIGTKHAVAVNSGTSGLFLCLTAMGIGPGDEVITTPFTFIASVTCIMMTGATPVFADIDPATLNIDPAQIEKKITPKTKAILPVEVFGCPAGFDRICQIAEKHNIPVLEDSCEALGSKLNGKMVGTFGQMSTFAFYPNKQMTTGEGGMIMTDDDHLADTCVSLRNQGRGKAGGWLGHDRLGYNYRLSDINCALGIVQLSRIEEIKKKRTNVAQMYQQALAGDPRIILPADHPGCDTSWFVFVVRLPGDPTLERRNAVLQAMLDNGIQVSNYFPPVHFQPFIAEQLGCKEGDYPVTEAVSKTTIALPFYNNLTQDDITLVCNTLKEVIDT
ncbi:MAG: DegT/DnrJ/EryC1/StrS family aminotransferase [Sedimentisphaerales bacterium]|nr:DegT/DnrJ/EryC1/StrS family aminotransferase [Sedimentisphaerales bacterium]